MASYRYERDIDPKDLTPRKKRTYTRKDADDLLSDGEALWQALTAGAVSTVTKEG